MEMKAFRMLAGLVAFCALAVAAGNCQTTTIFEIGKPDQSIREFSAAPGDHVVYQAGKNDWATQWPGEQRSGSRYEIQFDLAAPPRGVFHLKISALTSYPRIPTLQIEINGHKGVYYLYPKPLYLGEQRFRASDVLTVDLPANDLNQRTNNITLQLASSQPTEQNSSALPETVAYDFISLANDPSAKYARETVTANVIPTIFYREQNGHLAETIDAFVRFNQGVAAGQATLLINGGRYNASIPANSDAGEARLSFEVPEWQGATAAKLQIAAGNRHTFDLTLTPERKWTVYVVPHTHVDIGYTDYQGKVAEAQANTLVEAAEMIEQHPDFRFATDGSWNLQQLLETRPEPRRDQILGLIRDGKMGVPADYFNLLTGYASLETLYRSLYYSKALSREYGLSFNYATTTDVPSYTGAYPSVLASSGVKYWAVGGNQDRATVLAHEQWDEKSPFWWEGPDGGKVLFWYSRGYAQIRGVFGGNPQNESIYQALPMFLAPYDKQSYRPDAVLMYGAQDENTDLHPELPTFAPIWNHAFAYPKLQYATFADFFKYVDKQFGAELATYKGDMGPYWEDGIGSDAYYAAEDRNNQSRALAAEVVSTVAHVENPDVHPPKAELDDAWNDILAFAEHTWGAGNSIGQPDSEEATKQLAVKDNFATQAHFELENITNRSMYQLVNKVRVSSNTLVVFNALNWKRSALIEADFRRNQELVDLTTHKTIPLDVMWEKENFVHARFLAPDLPPVGYKCFQIRPVSGVATASVPAEMNTVIENRFYRITVDPETGAVRSIFDKQLNKEVADTASPYRFGQYLYVAGGDPRHNGLSQMIHPYESLPAAELTIHPAANGVYLGAQKTPWGYSIKLRSSDVNTPDVGLEILLFDNEKKIEFHYTVQKNYTMEKEGVYFAFPAAVASPEFAYATQQGWVDPARDMLKGASLEWFSVQKWMAVHGFGMMLGIVPLDASLASFGDINRGMWPAEFQPKTATLFSYAMNNYWHTNYRAGQGGEFTFRYVLTSGSDFDPASLSRLGWESMEAPTVDLVINQDKAGNPDQPLPDEGTSFLSIDNPNIVLVTWKLAEDGKGTILRLKEIAGEEEQAVVRLPRGEVRSASLCNSVEDGVKQLDVANNEVHLTFHPHEVLTVRMVH